MLIFGSLYETSSYEVSLSRSCLGLELFLVMFRVWNLWVGDLRFNLRFCFGFCYSSSLLLMIIYIWRLNHKNSTATNKYDSGFDSSQSIILYSILRPFSAYFLTISIS